jgi:glycosyltransferase involved in cell wall biosynthesis
MSCGLACIGPEVGGTREFMTPDNSLLVKYVGEEPVAPDVVSINPAFDGLSWAKHSWEDLATKMQRVVDDSCLRTAIALKGKECVRKNLTFGEIGRRISALLPE